MIQNILLMGIAAVAAFAAPQAATSAAALPKAETILDRYIEVTGGKAAYDKRTSEITTGTMELSESLRPFIPDHDAILMANHGVVTYGEDLCRAYMRMEAVEHYAKIVLATRQLGSARSLGTRELEKLFEVRSQYSKTVTNGH